MREGAGGERGGDKGKAAVHGEESIFAFVCEWRGFRYGVWRRDAGTSGLPRSFGSPVR